jgi:hypothetical protein
VAHLKRGPSCGQRQRGACRSEGLVTGKHVPDRLGELACDVDACDLLAALAAEALSGALVALAVGGAARGVGGGLDQRPAQVGGPFLARLPRWSRSPDW